MGYPQYIQYIKHVKKSICIKMLYNIAPQNQLISFNTLFNKTLILKQ